jgi:hypothetical protein
MVIFLRVITGKPVQIYKQKDGQGGELSESRYRRIEYLLPRIRTLSGIPTTSEESAVTYAGLEFQSLGCELSITHVFYQLIFKLAAEIPIGWKNILAINIASCIDV